MSHVVVVTIYGGEQDEQETYGPFATEQSAEGFADYLVSRPRLGQLFVGHAHVEPVLEPHMFFTRMERFGLLDPPCPPGHDPSAWAKGYGIPAR